jgi:hypothetical protein
MKTIQEEGGVSQEEEMEEMLAKSKPRNGTRKRKKISKKIVKMRHESKLLILGFKEIWSFY